MSFLIWPSSDGTNTPEIYYGTYGCGSFTTSDSQVTLLFRTSRRVVYSANKSPFCNYIYAEGLLLLPIVSYRFRDHPAAAPISQASFYE